MKYGLRPAWWCFVAVGTLSAQVVGVSQGPRCFPAVYAGNSRSFDSLGNDQNATPLPAIEESRSFYVDTINKLRRVDVTAIGGVPAALRRYYVYKQGKAYEYNDTAMTCKLVPLTGSGNATCFNPQNPSPVPSTDGITLDRTAVQGMIGGLLASNRVGTEFRITEIDGTVYRVSRNSLYLMPVDVLETKRHPTAPVDYGRYESYFNVTAYSLPFPSSIFTLPSTCSGL